MSGQTTMLSDGLRLTSNAGPGRFRRDPTFGVIALSVVVTSVVLLANAAFAPSDPSGAAETAGGERREFSVSARRYEFTPGRLEVDQDDLVKISFTAVDIPHSFTVDAYRIAKRAAAGQTVTFEFRASQPGTFPFYCNLAIDEGCREMHGELVVRAR